MVLGVVALGNAMIIILGEFCPLAPRSRQDLQQIGIIGRAGSRIGGWEGGWGGMGIKIARRISHQINNVE